MTESKPKRKPNRGAGNGQSGRPSKCTPEVRAKVVEAIRLGASIEQAAAHAGLVRQTLYNWLESKGTQYQPLQREVEQARHDRAVGWLGRLVAKANSEDRDAWKAAAWMLERTLPEQFGPRGQLALSRGRDSQPDVAELEAAATQGVGVADAAVLWQRQLRVLELAYQRGEVDTSTYLERMDRLGAQAARLAELQLKGPQGKEQPQVQLALTLDSGAIREPAPLPVGVAAGGRAPAGGDLIDVG